MKHQGINIIGTDTDVGKTFVTALLGAMAVDKGWRVGMSKPVASSSIPFDPPRADGALNNTDASTLMEAISAGEDRRNEVNPIALAGDFAPQLAAELTGIHIDYPSVVAQVRDVVNSYDITFVEGAGGITTPMTKDEKGNNITFTNLASDLGYPTVLIADGRLGSINRVILTCEYAKAHNIEVVGIIVNNTTDVDPFLLRTNVESMTEYTGLPVWGVLPPCTVQGPWTEKAKWAVKLIDTDTMWRALDRN